MATPQKKTPAAKPKRIVSTEGMVLLDNGTVRVWSTVGATVPIPDTFGSIKFSFGHERIAKSSSQEEIRKTAALMDEFNEEELERRLAKYQRLFARVANQDYDDEPTPEKKAKDKKKGKSAKDRARERMKDR